MECLNRFCIYQKDKQCILEVIELDDNGCCQSCIYPNIPPELLEAEKEKSRDKYREE